MFTPIVAKVVVTVFLGLGLGLFANAAEGLGDTTPPPPGVGMFGGPVTHVGSIEWDLSAPAGPLSRVRCRRGAADGTTCYVAG